MFAQLHTWLGCLLIAESNGENGGRSSKQETGESQFDNTHGFSFFSPLLDCAIGGGWKRRRT